jgi:hypothetical protein
MVQYTFHDGEKHGTDGTTATPRMIKETLSSNGHTRYTTILWDDGVYSCDCPGWCIAKRGKERTCKHIKSAQAANNDDMQAIDQFASTLDAPIKRSQLTIAPPSERKARTIRFVVET